MILWGIDAIIFLKKFELNQHNFTRIFSKYFSIKHTLSMKAQDLFEVFSKIWQKPQSICGMPEK